ncbi:hypothetical protein QBC32DRAFT_335392 [Pseudoneurospora amorphoporcata]|uniref:Uncharacterized protein n=1 Tax=Pseudoneurospora amorphoporcata TaxID=241081 RepID=A0AAN6NZ67_9PEZI|nr:hypothetical protein QBC32DRAFT_335392 [Pseudoneurospora amorphoporcata]
MDGSLRCSRGTDWHQQPRTNTPSPPGLQFLSTVNITGGEHETYNIRNGPNRLRLVVPILNRRNLCRS